MKITFSRIPRGSTDTISYTNKLVDRWTSRFERRNLSLKGEPVPVPEWHSNGVIAGEIEGGLPRNSGGRWFVVLESSPAELQGWLERYAAEQPKEAVSLLAKALQIAASKLEGEQSVEKEK